MGKIKYKEVPLEEIFDFDSAKTNGSRFTKTIINKNPGKIPVYGASLDGMEASYGYVSDNLVLDLSGRKQKVLYFENCLTWNIDGSIGLFYREGRFSLSEKVIPLIIRDELIENLDIEFLEKTILISAKNENYGFNNKPGKRKIEKIKIKIPIDNDGKFDIKKQKEISKKYKIIENKKIEIKGKLNYLNDVEINFLESRLDIVRELDFEELFSIKRGKVISKRYINDNKGDYPVYSTQLDEAFGYIDTYMYDGEYLIWNTDGLGGYIRLVDGKFSITNIVGIMKTKDKYKDIVNLEYIRRNLQPIFRENIKGREGLNGKNEYTKLNSTMIKNLNIKIKFPVDESGDINLDKQKEIVKKYSYIDEIKENMRQEVERLINIEIDFNGPTKNITEE